mmetsp:Transcript_80410/g.260570  ORF Transcript_80410/g.260570 Transcript_80410/m.260570 type:complete len:312 (-) Transcript_80410:414-1349(-)
MGSLETQPSSDSDQPAATLGEGAKNLLQADDLIALQVFNEAAQPFVFPVVVRVVGELRRWSTDKEIVSQSADHRGVVHCRCCPLTICTRSTKGSSPKGRWMRQHLLCEFRRDDVGKVYAVGDDELPCRSLALLRSGQVPLRKGDVSVEAARGGLLYEELAFQQAGKFVFHLGSQSLRPNDHGLPLCLGPLSILRFDLFEETHQLQKEAPIMVYLLLQCAARYCCSCLRVLQGLEHGCIGITCGLELHAPSPGHACIQGFWSEVRALAEPAQRRACRVHQRFQLLPQLPATLPQGQVCLEDVGEPRGPEQPR